MFSGDNLFNMTKCLNTFRALKVMRSMPLAGGYACVDDAALSTSQINNLQQQIL